MKVWIYLCILPSVFIFCAKQPAVIKELYEDVQYEINDTLPRNPDAIFGKLDNGLQYIIQANRKPEFRAELRLVVNAGSILEEENEKGLAHFCEHMAFNGTRHFKRQTLVDYLESIGMRFGPEINAYTGFDVTVFMLEVPTDSLKIVETGIQILADWAQYIQFEEKEIDQERSVILEEWRLGRGANARIRDQQLPVLFYGSRYADRLPIGDPAVIDTFHCQTIRQFYKDWYRPDLMAVIAVGDFDSSWIEQLVHSNFSRFENPQNKKKRKRFQIPDHSDTKVSIVTDPEATQTRIDLTYKYELLPEETVSDYRRSILESVYDSMFNIRLNELLNTEDPPYLAAFSGNSDLTVTKGAYTLGAIVEDCEIAHGLEVLLKEARRVRMFGFTESELERTKIRMLRFMEKLFQERDKAESSQYASEYVRYFTNNVPAPGIDYEYRLFQQFVPKISLQEVNALSRRWISDGNLVILVSGPEKSNLFFPDESDILQIFKDVQMIEIEPYEDKIDNHPLISELPHPGEIIKTTQIEPLNLIEWHLNNGVRVVLKPTDFKNDEILFIAGSWGGTSLAPDSLAIAASAASAIIQESGVGRFDNILLQKKLAGKIVHVSPEISGLTEGLSGQCSPQDMETLFQLIYLYFTAPRRDSTAYLSYKERIRGFLKNRSVKPESAYYDTIQVTMAQYHPRKRPWSNDMLDEIDLEYAYQFYKDRFADASDFTFYFVGNFTVESIKPYILTYLASLPDIGRNESWRDLGIETPKGHIEKYVFRGMESKSLVNLIFTGSIKFDSARKYMLQAMMDVLRIRLRKIIREELGGSYGVRVSGSIYKIPKETFDIRISFGCEPDRVDELTQAIIMQIDTLKQTGPKETDIQKVKENHLRTYEIHLKKNSYWLNQLYQLDLYGRDRLDILTYPETVQALKAVDIRQLAMMCFGFENYVRVVLFPENEHEKDK
ncbi:insulinase family protein [bacterium]|nr:insulinase family protein [bacterium]